MALPTRPRKSAAQTSCSRKTSGPPSALSLLSSCVCIAPLLIMASMERSVNATSRITSFCAR